MKELLIGKYGKLLAASAACIVVGGVAWIAMLALGLFDTSNMSNNMNWGLLIAMFAFLVGFGAGAQFVAAGIVLSGKEHLQRWAVPAQAIALAGVIGAAVAIIADLGSPWNILAMLLAPNFASPLTWDMVALTAFIVVAFICLVALAREWRSLKVWMAAGVVAALALQVVEGLLFALMQARAWWHSPLAVVDFVVVACVCGLAAVMFVAAFSRADEGKVATCTFGKLLSIAIAAHIVMTLAEVALMVAEGTPAAHAALGLIADYAPLYAIELVLFAATAVFLWARGKTAGRKAFIACFVATAVGVLAHRMMLLYPALSSSTLFVKLSNVDSPFWAYPSSTGLYGKIDGAFAIVQGYAPSVIEVVGALLPAGISIAIAVICVNVVRGAAARRRA